MESLKIVQKSWTSKKEVVINQSYLFIAAKNLQEDIEYQIKFEELGFDTVKKTIKTVNFAFYTFLCLGLLNSWLLVTSYVDHAPLSEHVLWLFGLTFFLICAVSSFQQYNRKVIYLVGGNKTLELFASKPDIETVLHFIEKIHEAMRCYYKEKYTKFDNETTYESKISTLKWLREIKVINEKEYSEYTVDLKTDGIIGFQRRNND